MLDIRMDDEEEILSTDDILDAVVASRLNSGNLSYFAFTATPKTKTLELFGRLPNPLEAPSKTNRPEAYHVYSMRQAIEEGFILDVLKNYINYKVAYNLALAMEASDQEVESKKARTKLNKWVRLHDYNISQKIQVIVEHFKDKVMGLLGGQAKAIVVTNSRKPAVERWKIRYKSAIEAYTLAREMFERTQKTADAVLIANAENSFKECKEEKDALEIFKKDLGTFVRFYEFISQIVNYDDRDLEKLSIYARNLRPMLRESLITEDDIDLDNVVLSHYRLSEIRRQDLKLCEDTKGFEITPGEGLGTAKAKDIKEELISQIISRLNELFITDELTDKDLVNYAYTIRDKVYENKQVMMQIANNSPEQAMLGDFSRAVDDAVMDSNKAHQNQMMQLLSDPLKAADFARVVFDLLNIRAESESLHNS